MTARICAAISPATTKPSCATSSLESSSPPSRAIFPKAAYPAGWRAKAKMSSLFPMFMKLEGKRCLVVGAGKVGEPKIGGLLETGAKLHVIAMEATETGHEWANAGKITLEIRAFASSDLEGVFMAVVATSSREL